MATRIGDQADAAAIAAMWNNVRPAIAAWYPGGMVPWTDSTVLEYMKLGVFIVHADGYFYVQDRQPPREKQTRSKGSQLLYWISTSGLSAARYKKLLGELFAAWFVDTDITYWGMLPPTSPLNIGRSVSYLRGAGFIESTLPNGWLLWVNDR